MTTALDGLEQPLRDALLDAFPSGEALNRLIRWHLDELPEVVAAGENLDARVDRLLQWAAKYRKVEALIAAACAENPANPHLIAIADDYRKATLPGGEPGRIETGDEVDVARIASLPRGPLVPADMIADALVRAFAAAAESGHLARRVLRRAASLRRAAEPPGGTCTVIQAEDLPVFEAIGTHAYWWDAFTEARKHGPRMLAALLFAQSDALFSAEASRERQLLLERLGQFGSPQTGK